MKNNNVLTIYECIIIIIIIIISLKYIDNVTVTLLKPLEYINEHIVYCMVLQVSQVCKQITITMYTVLKILCYLMPQSLSYLFQFYP